MKYTIITTQPQIYDSFFKTGLISRGIKKKIIKIKIINLYDFGLGTHKAIDDTPYGGGAGMVLRSDVMNKALTKLKTQNQKSKSILLTPQGKPFNQKIAKKLSKIEEIIFISGRFEGFDERIRDMIDYEISIGDYVLTSGDLPVMVLIDAVSRQIPGFIEKSESIKYESFSPYTLNPNRYTLLEYPQYTRPFKFKGKKIPKILLSGNHAEIAKWRLKQSKVRTLKRRPDLFDKST